MGAAMTPELLKMHPDAVMVCTTRELVAWWQSWTGKLYGIELIEPGNKDYITMHNDWLKRAVPPERVHFFSVKEGREPLCKILDVTSDLAELDGQQIGALLHIKRVPKNAKKVNHGTEFYMAMEVGDICEVLDIAFSREGDAVSGREIIEYEVKKKRTGVHVLAEWSTFLEVGPTEMFKCTRQKCRCVYVDYEKSKHIQKTHWCLVFASCLEFWNEEALSYSRGLDYMKVISSPKYVKENSQNFHLTFSKNVFGVSLQYRSGAIFSHFKQQIHLVSKREAQDVEPSDPTWLPASPFENVFIHMMLLKLVISVH
ncbi:hypothetical protein BDZ45DRAFT_756156 [Acephala macrosclerotiorum]|nr:hypothetical protein BDZ45DRAFT_756156 [Acephala macrosclerotiorum]